MKQMRMCIRAWSMCLLILFMAGCHNKKTENKEWILNRCDIEGLDGAVVELTMITEEEFYVATQIMGSDDGMVEKIYHVSLGEKRAEQIPISLEKGFYAMNIVSLEEDGFAAILSKEEEEVFQKEELVIVDREGRIKAKKDILEITDPQEVITILATKEGGILVVTSKHIYELDASLNKAKEHQASALIENATIDEDGHVLCICGTEGKEDGAKTQICILDLQMGKWEKLVNLKLERNDVAMRLITTGKNSFLLFGVNGIYKCDENGNADIFLKFAEQRLGDETWKCLTVLPNGEFFSCVNEGGNAMLGYLNLEAVEAQITKIVVGGIFMDYSVVRELKEYHQTHPDVLVEIREYDCDMSSVASMNEASNRLNADILSGNGPDIVYLQGLDHRMLCEQGLLENLDSYFDKDPKVSMENIIPSLREALSVNGSVYYVVPSFTIATLVGKSKLVGDSMGWTMKEAYDCWKEHGADMFLERGDSAFYELIYGLMQNDNVDMADIRMAMEMADMKGKENSYVTEKNAALKDERALLTVGGMSEFWYIQMFHAMFDEENITLKGFPGLQGSGAMFFVDNSMGISSKSPHKDVAWDMIKIFLSEEYQSVKNDNLFYFPSREDCFEEMLRECSKKKSKYNSYLGMEMSNNEDRIIVTALSIADAERIRQMVYDTKMVYHKSYLYDMVIEEASSYFSGNKRIDDVYEIIKDRIDLYYKEGK